MIRWSMFVRVLFLRSYTVINCCLPPRLCPLSLSLSRYSVSFICRVAASRVPCTLSLSAAVYRARLISCPCLVCSISCSLCSVWSSLRVVRTSAASAVVLSVGSRLAIPLAVDLRCVQFGVCVVFVESVEVAVPRESIAMDAAVQFAVAFCDVCTVACDRSVAPYVRSSVDTRLSVRFLRRLIRVRLAVHLRCPKNIARSHCTAVQSTQACVSVR